MRVAAGFECRVWATALGLCASIGTASAQSPQPLLRYRDLESVRERQYLDDAFVAIHLGAAAVIPEDTDIDEGRDTELVPTGSVFAHAEDLLAGHAVDAYLGPDGGLISIYRRDDLDSLSGRLDLSARPLAFYRDGFYRGDEFVTVGAYEGLDFGVFLAIEQRLVEDLTLSFGPTYRRFDFDDRFGGAPDFVRPGDFNAFGLRLSLEHSRRIPDRNHPDEFRGGTLLTLRVDYEANDQRGVFGGTDYSSSLPGSVFRGAARFEVYQPLGEGWIAGLRCSGGLHERDDRIAIADAQSPVGTAFVDAALGIRYADEDLSVEPMFLVQAVRALDAFGQDSDGRAFFGGAVRAAYNLGPGLRFTLDASYLNNANRPVVTWDRGVLGEFQVLTGLEIVF